MTLVREILLAVEARPPPGQGLADVQIPGVSSEEISYHVKIMAEAGLIEAKNTTTMQNFSGALQASPGKVTSSSMRSGTTPCGARRRRSSRRRAGRCPPT